MFNGYTIPYINISKCKVVLVKPGYSVMDVAFSFVFLLYAKVISAKRQLLTTAKG